jgi:hypothetical protein
MNTATTAVQDAIYERLKTHASVGGSSVPVYYDLAPTNLKTRHVVIDGSSETPRGVFGAKGWEGFETVHAWVPGVSCRPARALAGDIIGAMLSAPLEMDGGLTSLMCRVDFGPETLTEPDWCHAVVRFRLWTLDASE